MTATSAAPPPGFDATASFAALSKIMAEPIKRLPVTDPKVLKMLKTDKPVVITGSKLCDKAVNKWDLRYLAQYMDPSNELDGFSVRHSSQQFMYADVGKNDGSWAFQYPVKVTDTKFSAFCKDIAARLISTSADQAADCSDATPAGPRSLLSLFASTQAQVNQYAPELRPALDEALHPSTLEAALAMDNEGDSAANVNFYSEKGVEELTYLQTTPMSGVGRRIMEDFQSINFSWLTKMQEQAEWGPLSSNLLLIGQRGCITPFHYDEMQNMFAQVHGRKLFILSPPSSFKSFYPYPIGHPADRQASVDARCPDLSRFPNFSKADFVYCVLEPGDVLYLPAYWWHYAESPYYDAPPSSSLTTAAAADSGNAAAAAAAAAQPGGDDALASLLATGRGGGGSGGGGAVGGRGGDKEKEKDPYNFKALDGHYSISLNFWYRSVTKPSAPPPEIPLRDPTQRQALRRNIEKIAGQSFGAPTKSTNGKAGGGSTGAIVTGASFDDGRTRTSGFAASSELFRKIALQAAYREAKKLAQQQQRSGSTASSSAASTLPPAPPQLTALEHSVRVQLLTLLTNVLDPSDCEPFLEEICADRFNHPKLCAGNKP